MNILAFCFLCLITFLQIATVEPFFGIKVEGGFKTETDISSSALGITASLLPLKTAVNNLNRRIPLSTLLLGDATDGVNYLYSGIVGEIQNFTDTLGKAAVDSTTEPALFFNDLFAMLANAQDFVKGSAPQISKITALSSSLGETLAEAFTIVESILNDLSEALLKFEEAVGVLSTNTQVTPAQIYKVLNKYQLANLIGALNVFQSQIEIASGNLVDVASMITTPDIFMSSFTTTLTSAFASLDALLSNAYNTITSSSDTFLGQVSTTLSQLTSSTKTFNDKINAFTDDIIGANSSKITISTTQFLNFYQNFMDILIPNSEEKFNAVAYMVTDSVQMAARDTLFNTYQMLDNAVRNLPTATTCATKFLNPLVTSLSMNIPSMGMCLNLLNPQTVANGQFVILKKLLADRLYYVNLWNSAIAGVTSKSDASVRQSALLKLTAKTLSSNMDVQQPALVDTYSIFAQLVSNFNSLQNRVVMCLTLKSIDFSALVIAASNSYFTCIKS